MEVEFHVKSPDGRFTPIIVDPMADADQAAHAAKFIAAQSVERLQLIAAGERVS